jgi:uncharacterized protein
MQLKSTRHIALLFALLLMPLMALAAVHQVSDIPNVHLNDSTQFVSNPDGILSAEAKQRADSTLQMLMRTTTAEVTVAVVDDITEDADIDDFTTDLFRAWGIGKSDKNNGLLILVVKNRRQVVFRTGYGLEGLLTDGTCGSIIRNVMKPYFRQEDYDSGVCMAVKTVSDIITNPDARDEVLSAQANNANAGSDNDDDGDNLFAFYCVLSAITLAAFIFAFCVQFYNTRRASRMEKYLAFDSLKIPVLIASLLTMGFSLPVLVAVLIMRHRLRRGKHVCTVCATRMNLVDEVHDNDYLTHSQDLEEKIQSVDYDVWLCPTCGETEILPYVQKASTYAVCPVCAARTMRMVSDRITIQPTTTRTGLREITHHCLNCGYDDIRRETLPKSEPIIIVGGGRGGFGSGGGGGFSGGSFGGGLTGGGGARGGW